MTKRDKKSICMEIMIPICLVLVGLLVRFNKPVLPEFSAYHLTIDKFSTPQKLLFGYEDTKPLIQSLEYSKIELIENKDLESFTDYLSSHWDISPKRMGSFYKKDENSEVFIFNNQTSFQSSATFYTAYTTELIRKVDPEYNLRVYNHPFPPTHDMDDISFLGDGFIGSLLVGMGCTFIPVGIIGLVMKEKEQNIKHQHVISGMSLWSYWTSYFMWDIIKHILPSVMIPVLTLLFDLQAFVDKDIKIYAQFLLILIFGFAIFPFTYASTFVFSKFTTAQYVTIGVHFLTGCALPSALYVMLFYKSLRNTVKVLVWVFKVFPNFCLGWGVMNIGSGKNIAALYELDEEMNPFNLQSAGGDILVLGIICLASTGLLIYAEYRSANPRSSKSSSSEPKQVSSLDEDVQKEYIKAQNSDQRQVKINIRGISKSFKTFTAVNDLGFNVEDGECFALLGINGAGKTTTFKMLTGELHPSSGQIFIGGSDVTQEQSKARTLIGYCPQFDCLNETLSVQEHLFLYSSLKGIPKHLAPELVQDILTELDLQSYKKQLAGRLSGGNKRKLSVAIALIGNPTAVLLDEPSAGMDPGARKKMWKVLGKVKKNGAAVILTTHSMEEAEALSDRMAIMVRGQFKCIGSASWIKNKFGEGFEIEVKINSPGEKKVKKMMEKIENLEFLSALKKLKAEFLSENIGFRGFRDGTSDDLKVLVVRVCIEKRGERFKKWLLEKFAYIEEVEHFLSYYKYNVQKQDIQLGHVFSEIQANKEKLKISEYSISQTSLDQIFDTFARSDIISNQE
jgi:ATP-binding cassette subfamily A (ABC1) protein 3